MYEKVFGNSNLILNIIKTLGAAKSGLMLTMLTISDEKYSNNSLDDKGITIDDLINSTKQEYDGQFEGILEELIADRYVLKAGNGYHPTAKILELL